MHISWTPHRIPEEMPRAVAERIFRDLGESLFVVRESTSPGVEKGQGRRRKGDVGRAGCCR
jgi:hypothetical protein